MKLSARQIGHLCDGQVSGKDAVFTQYFSDSRKVIAGGLFIALEGETFDGNDFAADVLAQGAGGVLVSRELNNVGPDACVIRVADTQRALTTLGIAARAHHDGTFIVITGSVGKTTAKDMTAAALAPFGKVGKTPGNLNNHIGVPLTLVNLDGDERFVVLEIGMSAPGEIARLTVLTRPDVGLVTRVAAAHLAFFKDVQAIADAKAELYEHLPRGAKAIANADDALMLPRINSIISKAYRFGRDAHADLRIEDVATRDGAIVVTLNARGERVVINVMTPGEHNAENVAAAMAVVKICGLELSVAAQALAAGFRPGKHRLEVVRMAGLTVLDDCYNANPASMHAAIAAFAKLAPDVAADDRLIIVGTMRELGPDAAAFHREVGAAASATAGHIIATGEHAADVAAGAPTTHVFADVEDALPFLDAWIGAHTNGAVLLKGSRGERLERVLAPIARTTHRLLGGT